MTCKCNLAGLIATNYSGIISASINGSTNISLADDGLVLLGNTTNSLAITAYPFSPGGDQYMGVNCPSSVNVSMDWIQKYDCFNNKNYFIPKLGGKGTVVGDNIWGITILCDPNLYKEYFEASASSGPTSFAIDTERKDIFGIRYSGNPIQINTLSPQKYNIRIGSYNIYAYLQSFSLDVKPPTPASVNYTFIF